MSTVTKLDPMVRLNRTVRKNMRRDMQKDQKTIEGFIARGQYQLKLEEIISKDPEYSAQTRGFLKELFVRRAVTAAMFDHISKICRDPKRTGARKEAILTKLGGEA